VAQRISCILHPPEVGSLWYVNSEDMILINFKLDCRYFDAEKGDRMSRTQSNFGSALCCVGARKATLA